MFKGIAAHWKCSYKLQPSCNNVFCFWQVPWSMCSKNISILALFNYLSFFVSLGFGPSLLEIVICNLIRIETGSIQMLFFIDPNINIYVLSVLNLLASGICMVLESENLHSSTAICIWIPVGKLVCLLHYKG